MQQRESQESQQESRSEIVDQTQDQDSARHQMTESEFMDDRNEQVDKVFLMPKQVITTARAETTDNSMHLDLS